MSTEISKQTIFNEAKSQCLLLAQ